MFITAILQFDFRGSVKLLFTTLICYISVFKYNYYIFNVENIIYTRFYMHSNLYLGLDTLNILLLLL